MSLGNSVWAVVPKSHLIPRAAFEVDVAREVLGSPVLGPAYVACAAFRALHSSVNSIFFVRDLCRV